MWELQPLSTNRRTTKISLLLGENTSLTPSQIPHNFMGLLSLFYFPFLLSCGAIKAWMHCLLQASIHVFILQKTRAPIGAASGTELMSTLLT